MPISESHVGKTYPPTPAYEVSVAKIAEFARALGDDNPAYGGEAAIAPPTFVAVLAAAAWEALFTDPELGLALHRVVHGDQRFDYTRPLRAGDRVTTTLAIDRVKVRGQADVVTVAARVDADDGEEICTIRSTFFHTREEAA